MAGEIMNKQRRKELERIADLLSECMSGLESVKEEEQEAYDNLPGGIQYSERGEAMQENVDDLDYVISDLDSVISSINEIIEK